MNLLYYANQELFPEHTYTYKLAYSGKFKGYNANIKKQGNTITANLSKEWKTVSPDIQKGLLHELLLRLHKKPGHTIHIDLYHNFLKSLSTYAPKTTTHPILEKSFKRVNEQFFAGIMQQPNLALSFGLNTLGTYHYATDTIKISETLLDTQELLDYVMYHELLHKKHQFKNTGKRTRHHSFAFREDERKFPNYERIEKELQRHIMKFKRTSW